MPSSLSTVMLEAITKPVAFFNDEGLLLKNNNAWEMICSEHSSGYEILFYNDFITQFSLPPIHDDDTMEINDAECNNRFFKILRRRMKYGKKKVGAQKYIDLLSILMI